MAVCVCVCVCVHMHACTTGILQHTYVLMIFGPVLFYEPDLPFLSISNKSLTGFLLAIKVGFDFLCPGQFAIKRSLLKVYLIIISISRHISRIT